MIITLTGDIGSGKSRVSLHLKSKLGFKLYSTGRIQRLIAEKRNMTTLELNRFSEKDQSIDDEIDGFTKSLRNSKEGLIIDSRLAWHFIPDSFKVYLFLDSAVAAERIFNDKNRIKESYSTLQGALKAIRERQKSEAERFHKLYQVKLNDWDNYDVVINTEKVSALQVAEKIIDAIHQKKENNERLPKKIFF